jgi:hypothetical protein
MDSSGKTLVKGYIYHINNKYDEYSTTKEGGDYIYLGTDEGLLNNRHRFQPIDISGNFFTISNNLLLYIPLKSLSGEESPYTVTLKNRVAEGGRRKIRKQTRKTRARRLNRRKHTRKH